MSPRKIAEIEDGANFRDPENGMKIDCGLAAVPVDVIDTASALPHFPHSSYSLKLPPIATNDRR